MNVPPEDRSTVAVAWAWASRIMAICTVMVLPSLVGYWVDSRFNTKALFTLLGCALGMALGMWQLIRIVNTEPSKNNSSKDE